MANAGPSQHIVWESFTNPHVALARWAKVFHERLYCRFASDRYFPNRDICEDVIPVNNPFHRYLRVDYAAPAHSSYCVVVRGLRPGVYASWYVDSLSI